LSLLALSDIVNFLRLKKVRGIVTRHAKERKRIIRV
jgi:hypothetical protein